MEVERTKIRLSVIRESDRARTADKGGTGAVQNSGNSKVTTALRWNVPFRSPERYLPNSPKPSMLKNKDNDDILSIDTCFHRPTITKIKLLTFGMAICRDPVQSRKDMIFTTERVIQIQYRME